MSLVFFCNPFKPPLYTAWSLISYLSVIFNKGRRKHFHQVFFGMFSHNSSNILCLIFFSYIFHFPKNYQKDITVSVTVVSFRHPFDLLHFSFVFFAVFAITQKFGQKGTITIVPTALYVLIA